MMTKKGKMITTQTLKQVMISAAVKYLLFGTGWVMVFPHVLTAQHQPVRWLEVTGAAAWQPRDSQGKVVNKGYMRLLGGWHSSYEPPPRDVWRSRDGKNWSKLEVEGQQWQERHEHSAYIFQDKLWIVGGMTPPLVIDVWYLKLRDHWR